MAEGTSEAACLSTTGSWALVGGAVVYSAYSAYEQAKVDAIMLKHASTMAGFDAEAVELQTSVAESDFRKKASTVKGAARVAAGASGFAADSGSSLDAIQDIDYTIEINAAAIRAEGAAKAGAIKDRAAGLSKQSELVGDSATRTALSTALQFAPALV